MRVILIESCGKISLKDCNNESYAKDFRSLVQCISFSNKEVPLINDCLAENSNSNVNMIYCDEESYEKDFNLLASCLVSGGQLNLDTILIGNVLLVNYIDGEFCDFSDTEFYNIEKYVKCIRNILIDNTLGDLRSTTLSA